MSGAPEHLRIVPPHPATARLVVLSAAAMAFLAALAVALVAVALRTGAAWEAELSGSATLHLPADMSQSDAEAATALALYVLSTTPGIANARIVDTAEQRRLLEPWFGRDLPLDALSLPPMIAITATSEGYDAASLRLRLAGELPEATLDDHARWRAPLTQGVRRMQQTAAAGLGVILAALAAVTALAAQAALATHARVVAVLRLVGARDAWIARAFVGRITRNAALGAATGTVLAALLLASLPDTAAAGLPALRPSGWSWLLLIPIPPLAAGIAYLTARLTTRALLKGLP